MADVSRRPMVRRPVAIALLTFGLVLLATLAACGGQVSDRRPEFQRNGARFQAYTLDVSFEYDGQVRSDKLPFECWRLDHAAWSGVAGLPSEYVASPLPDGSVLVFRVNGVCDELQASGKSGVLGFSEERFRGQSQAPVRMYRLTKTVAIGPRPVIWMSEPRSPRRIEVYLTPSARREGGQAYRALSFAVSPAAAAKESPDALASMRAPQMLRWNEAIGRDYCGGVFVEARVGELARPDLSNRASAPLTIQPAALKPHWGRRMVTPPYRFDGPGWAQRTREAAQAIVYDPSTGWRTETTSSHVMRLYRRDLVPPLSTFDHHGVATPFGPFAVALPAGGSVLFNTPYCGKS